MSRDVMPPGRLLINSELVGQAARLSLHGELDLASVPQLEAELASIEAQSPKRIVVDLDQLAFIDSTGLRTLIQADARAREQGWELLLSPGDQSIQRVFELTGAVDVLRFEPVAGQS
jgi:anti-anti-sigma factor